MLLFRGEELAFSSAFSPVTIRKIMKCPPRGEDRRKKKGPASKNIGDEQLSLLRLLAGKVPHELRMLRDLF